MDKLIKDKARVKLIARLSLISAILSVFLVIGSILLLWYVPMGIFIAVAVHGFYFTPFYYIRHEDLTRLEIVLGAKGEGIPDNEICDRAAISEAHLKKLLALAEKKGYTVDRAVLTVKTEE